MINRDVTTKQVSMGKSGRDQVSRFKALTVVMIPYERFSPFPKAVDELYKNIDVPFNLIVVEGNAPDCIRMALEKRQRQHRNITIVYSRHRPSITGAINLAIPHVKTKYALIMDNDVHVPKGAAEGLIESAERSSAEIIVPKNCLVEREFSRSQEGSSILPKNEEMRSLGIRSCFLISQSAIEKLGRLDEEVSPFTAGADITLMARQKSIHISADTEACLEASVDGRIKPLDAELFTYQWNTVRTSNSLKHFREKWGMDLLDSQYRSWFAEKQKKINESRGGLHLSEIMVNINTAMNTAGRNAAGLLAQVSGVKVRD